jgi:hypothetical protein
MLPLILLLICAIHHIGSIDIETDTNNSNIDDFVSDIDSNNNIEDTINFYFKIRNLLFDEYNKNNQNNENNENNEKYNNILHSEKDSWFLQYTTSKPIPIINNKK